MKRTNLSVAALALMICPLEAQSLVGSWFLPRSTASQSDVVLTFLANGTYLMAEDGDRKRDPNGQDGMERGTYKWNAATKAFSSKTLVDTTREWGLSDASIKSITLKGNAITLGGTGGISLGKIASKTNKLVGSWYFKKADGYVVCTFLSNGTYFQVEDGETAGGGRTGMERGTYTWNPTTKVLTRKVQVDTNGTWGLSDNLERSISISGSKLTLTVAGEGDFTAARVIEPINPKAAPGSPTRQLLESLRGH